MPPPTYYNVYVDKEIFDIDATLWFRLYLTGRRFHIDDISWERPLDKTSDDKENKLQKLATS